MLTRAFLVRNNENLLLVPSGGLFPLNSSSHYRTIVSPWHNHGKARIVTLLLERIKNGVPRLGRTGGYPTGFSWDSGEGAERSIAIRRAKLKEFIG
jgi:hypothetical protein